MNVVGQNEAVENGMFLEALLNIHKKVTLKQTSSDHINSFVMSDQCIKRKEAVVASLSFNIETLSWWRHQYCKDRQEKWVAGRMIAQWKHTVDLQIEQINAIKFYMKSQRSIFDA